MLTDAILDRMIQNAENRIYRSADNDDNRFYATSTLATGNRYVTIPSDLRIIRYVQLKDTSTGKQVFLEKKILRIWQLIMTPQVQLEGFQNTTLTGMQNFG